MLKDIYSNIIVDNIIIYFMKTILQIEKNGIVNLSVRNDFKEPLKKYIDISVNLIINGEVCEISDLILKSEYDLILKNESELDINTILCLNLIKEISYHIHYDSDMYSYILNLMNLWGNSVYEYASLTFYPNMSNKLKEKYGIDELIKYIPKEMYRLDDF